MTDKELEFLGRLEAGAPQLRFHAQVSMAAIVQPAVDRSSPEYTRIRNQFGQKIVDFVVQAVTRQEPSSL